MSTTVTEPRPDPRPIPAYILRRINTLRSTNLEKDVKDANALEKEWKN